MKRIAILLVFLSATSAFAGSPTIIAHRGASGYVAEHTRAAYAYAHALGADYIEQDVVLTKDAVPIIMHDVILETTTNVAELFPDRNREDGHFYAIDFTLEEIKQLHKGERLNGFLESAAYPKRFPAKKFLFKIQTLEEALVLIQGLNQSTGREAGIYPEIKKPDFHREEGMDPVAPFMDVLEQFGYTQPGAPCFIQCFDAPTVRQIRKSYGDHLKLIQLIGENLWGESTTDYDYLRSAKGVKEIASYADGIGPRIERLVHLKDGQLEWTPLFHYAKKHNLKIHPFTFRQDDLPFPGISESQFLDFVFQKDGFDGIFTDFPDMKLPNN